MSGSNYAHCEHCGRKAFYDADTDINDCVVFHPECLTEHDRQVTEKAWDEGHASGHYNAGSIGDYQVNPYREDEDEDDN